MSDISSTGVSTNSIYWGDETVVEETDDGMLSQEDFFMLLSQQLANQDPFEPTDNDEMISQMSSFATVDGIEALNESIDDMNASLASSQALEASGLVGQKVLIPSSQTFLDETGSISGVVSVPDDGTGISVNVLDDSGQIVKTIPITEGETGNVDFTWDGTDEDGERLPAGEYTYESTGMTGGSSESIPTYAYAHVSSVTLGGVSNPTVLNLKGLGGISLSEVLAVSEG
ncbi:flagellar hook assembly protein FlgD [Ferrimonas lipolytica]|uniref:Basal-body rod modification protein FlgD n=1 Tax=Ferrimonas lipolytica TaxID=2724191 RepID=A0A6H1UF76_9GAMM|nr:flagellar hook assembly protein FlgD [Ferrimonas lipolytica]QIZ77250.1 flagellar hook assembly protein FlgD [Ferrimonas lipolytica]